ncbi:MAG: hypothetical protein J6A28_01260 [Clostridia bacterium]|nr:hypothetical protein [Clostridia bacterium]
MVEKNPYYISKEDTKRLTSEQIRAAKYNNVFLISMFTNLVGQNCENPSATAGKHRAQINIGELPCSEAATGIPQYELGKKLEFLLATLTNSADARTMFMKSYFSTLIARLRDGSVGDNKSWEDYRKTANCDSNLANRTPINAALLCYSQDDSMEIGINFAKVIDCLIRKTNTGKYDLVNFDENKLQNKDVARQMALAFNNQLKSFKSNSRFMRNFKYDPNSESYL